MEKGGAVKKSRRSRLNSFKKELSSFLTRHDLWTDTMVYSKISWRVRREEVGKGSILSMTFEGALYRVMNDWHWDDLREQFEGLARSYGFFWEMGHAWSAHLYDLNE